MPLTRAEMEALLPDNSEGEISAQDMRDIVVSCLTIEEEGNAVTKADKVISDTQKILLEGGLPTVNLAISGGSEATINIIDLDEGKTVGQIVYDGLTQAIDIRLEDPVNTSNKCYLSLNIDGSVTNPTAPQEIQESDDLVVARQLEEPFRLKADIEYVNSAIVNTYAGTTVPSSTLGKDGDRYHRYASSVTQTFKQGVCLEDYSEPYTEIYYDGSVTDGVYSIGIEPSTRKVYVDYTNLDDHNNTPVLNIGGTNIPLEVKSRNTAGFVGTYASSYDSTIAGITTSTAFELNGNALSGPEEDYTNFSGTWYLTPIFNHTYDFEKAGIPSTGNPVTITEDTYQPIVALITDNRDAGTYEVSFSLTFNYSTTNRSAFVQWTIDGGTSWEIFSVEPKDATDTKSSHYAFPITHGGGALDLRLMGKCEQNGDTLTIHYANITLDRKK